MHCVSGSKPIVLRWAISSHMPESILITGGSGLLATNWAVSARGRYDITLGVHNRDVSLAGVNSKVIDLDSMDGIVHVLKELKPKFVVHTAGLANVERCETEPAMAQHVNVNIARNVAQACAALRVKLIHVSTDHLFSGEDPLLGEEEDVSPLNVYAKTKAEAEQIVLQVEPTTIVIRTNFFCWGPKYRRSFSDFVIDALRAGKKLVLFQDVFYTPILVEEVVKVVEELVAINASGIFNVVGDDRISKYEFGRSLAQEFGLDLDKIVPTFFVNETGLVQRPLDMSLTNEKVCKLLGRRLGGIKEYLKRLRQQENDGVAAEIKKL